MGLRAPSSRQLRPINSSHPTEQCRQFTHWQATSRICNLAKGLCTIFYLIFLIDSDFGIKKTELYIFSEMRTLVISEEDVHVSVSIISLGSCLHPMWGCATVVEERLEG